MSSHPESTRSSPCKTCNCNNIIRKECVEKSKDMIYCRMIEKYIGANACYGKKCEKRKDNGYCALIE